MISTIELVPENFRNDPQVIAACVALDAELKEIYAEIPSVAFWPNLDVQTTPMLDVLMWEMHVDVYQHLTDGTPYTDDDKRDAIDKSIPWHQKKGTKWIVEQVLQAYWPTAVVTEWFQYGGRPFFFRIAINETLDAATLARVIDAIMAVKNVRSWLEGIDKTRESKLQLYVGQLNRFRNTTKVYMSQRIFPIGGS